jgi:hypothetical protein
VTKTPGTSPSRAEGHGSARQPGASRTRCVDRPCHRRVDPRSAFRGPDPGWEDGRKCDFPGVLPHVFVDDPSRIRAPDLSFVQNGHGRRNSCRPFVAPPDPLLPGRLVAATPSRGRHETPGTQLGRAASKEVQLGRPQRPRTWARRTDRYRLPQTQAPEPESAQISAAIRSCSAFGAFWGSPWPP